MDNLYLTVNTDEGTTLCLAPLTDRQIELSAQQIPDPSGYFLFERVGGGATAKINVLAQIVSEEAVDRVRLMLNME